jgi:hypothetical protein
MCSELVRDRMKTEEFRLDVPAHFDDCAHITSRKACCGGKQIPSKD